MIKTKQDNINPIIDFLIRTRRTFKVEIKRDNSAIFVANKLNDYKPAYYSNNWNENIPAMRRSKAIGFIGQVKKAINNYLAVNFENLEEIKQANSSTYINRDLIYSLPLKTELNLLDIRHCYWRIAYLKGYINEKLYKKALGSDYKTLRNIALACIVSAKGKIYYENGVKINEIWCDHTLYRTIYDNIRFYAYNVLQEILGEVGEKYILACRTDSVLVLPSKISEVAKVFKSHDLSYRIKECYKINDMVYKEIGADKPKKY